jgi:hypothetical protein
MSKETGETEIELGTSASETDDSIFSGSTIS